MNQIKNGKRDQQDQRKYIKERQSKSSCQFDRNSAQKLPKDSKIRAVAWKISQLLGYHNFLIKKKALLANDKMRRRKRVFVKMSQEIGTKTAAQCRSHHQKAVWKYGNLQKLLNFSLQFVKLRGLKSQNTEKNQKDIETTDKPKAEIQMQMHFIEVQDITDKQQLGRDIWTQQLAECNCFDFGQIKNNQNQEMPCAENEFSVKNLLGDQDPM